MIWFLEYRMPIIAPSINMMIEVFTPQSDLETHTTIVLYTERLIMLSIIYK